MRGVGRFGSPIAPLVAIALATLVGEPTAVSWAASKVGDIPHSGVSGSSAPQQIAEEGFLAERMRKLQEAKIDEVVADVKKNPKVLDDPKYLAAHPRLAKYLEKHPDAKDKIKQDPAAFFQHLKDEGRDGIGG